MIILAIAAAALFGCHATDGDTIRCGAERMRLLGIDAPELPGHCRRGRSCAAGDPFRSKMALSDAMRSEPISAERVGTDRYGRTIAIVWAGTVNLSCHQLSMKTAAYVAKWDNGYRIATACPAAALKAVF